MIVAKTTIVKWFENKSDDDKKKFIDTLLEKVQFIWYESTDKDPIKVFTRLNIGKIPLTNAELIKALFLNKSNFEGTDYHKIKLQQQEIASEWDNIEYTLQNDEFWLFLNKADYDRPTRIDYIFDLMCEKNTLELTADEMKEIRTDEDKTFRYFYAWFNQPNQSNITECWQKVKTLFQTFQEWFNDLELYHYTGFLIESKTDITTIIDKWNESTDKQNFINEYIIEAIKRTLSNCKDLNKQYEVSGNPKTQCRPILLLHNIQTVINQNKTLKESEKYKLPVFYKFPFHLFKKENWDVEHIDSHTENALNTKNDQNEWLKYSYDFVDDTAIKEKIKSFLKQEDGEEEPNFDGLYSEIISATGARVDKLVDGAIDENGNQINEKDKLWNFCLLDSSTNRSYQNAIFPVKRRILTGKDQGKTININDSFEVEEKGGAIAFIPPCTRNVFIKYNNPKPTGFMSWNKQDAEMYLKNIETTLEKFLK
jgi:hypothetical protein